MKEKIIPLIIQFKADRRLSKFDEAATKQIVVLRILSLLGWDTYDIDQVKPEHSVGGQRVDYALRCSNKNKVFLEVKKVGEDLEAHQEQLLNYSFKEGVKLAILTNGISWRFYLPLHEGSWEQRKFYTIELNDQDTDDIADRFISYLSKENVQSEKAIENAEAIYKSRQKEYVIKNTLPIAWNKLLSEPDELLIELIEETTEKLCGYKPANSVVEDFISLNVLGKEELIISRPEKERAKKHIQTLGKSYIGKSVSAFYFKNKRYEVKYWIEVITQLAKILYDNNRNNFSRVLQLKGRKRPYFTKNPDELRIPQIVEDSDIFMETNLSSQHIVIICRDMIELFGNSEKDFSVEAQ
jgi:hypothetical protein